MQTEQGLRKKYFTGRIVRMADKITLEIIKLHDEKRRYETSHAIHLLATLFTGGLWLIPWIFITMNNRASRTGIEMRIKKITEGIK